MDTSIRSYLVGGAVRDQIMGLKPHDMDYAVEAPSFAAMKFWLEDNGATIFQERPEFGVIRARVGREAADYILCRKDGPYTDGRHPDYVEQGTLLDDLARRDFTVNAIAQEKNGSLIDPFYGIDDIENKMLRAVGDAYDRLDEDPLRAFRAIRFSITKNFTITYDLRKAMQSHSIFLRMYSVSTERIREELHKTLSYNTYATINLLHEEYPKYLEIMKERGIWLKPTTETPNGH